MKLHSQPGTDKTTDQSIMDWPVYMERALLLAQSVLTTAPNPRVGCVLLSNGKVVGEGWHVAAGQDHAEVMALKDAGSSARGATAFVSLEPCAHHGRTGPCCEALIEAGVSRVVLASIDPNPAVAGLGVEKMEQAGLEVVLLSEFDLAAREINPGYFKRREKGLPFVRLKLAMSLDGRTALANGESKWITGESARADVQRLRAQSSAIVTGINTVLADDPAMTVRAEEFAGLAQPLRVILDSQMRTPGTARIVNEPGNVKIVTSSSAARSEEFAANVEVLAVESSGQGVDLTSVLELLAREYESNEVMVEAGPTLSGQFIRQDLVDELIIYIAPKLLGSDGKALLELTGISSMTDTINYSIKELKCIGEDIRLTLRPNSSGSN